MFAFQLGLRSRRWVTKKEALEEDIKNPKPRKERPEGKGVGPKLGKYDVLKGKGRKGKKDGKTDKFGKFDAGRVTKKGEKGRKKKERKPKGERKEGQAKEGGELVRNPNRPADGGDAMQY
jgi:hypothetical protein